MFLPHIALVIQNFLVDIKGPNVAFLPVLSFEGGTRRNIPKFEVWHWGTALSSVIEFRTFFSHYKKNLKGVYNRPHYFF